MHRTDLCLLLLASGGLAQPFHIDPTTQQIVDDCGRARIFHGVNAVEKVAPNYLPSLYPTEATRHQQDVLDAQDMALLQSLGMNLVRLGVLMVGAVPSEGVVNATYLASAKAMITALGEKGIHTLVDMHQDLLSPWLCGEGLPDWATFKGLALAGFDLTDPATSFPLPLPFDDVPPGPGGTPPNVTDCLQHGFFLYYTSFESEALWHSLYAFPEMWGAVAGHWSAVAAALAGSSGLLGYEMLNEPWPAKPANPDPANIVADGALSDNATLGGLYGALHEAVRAEDAHTLFFFEPLVLASYEEVVPRRTTDFPPGGPGGGDGKSVFAYHSYCASGADGSVTDFKLCRELVHASWEGAGRNLGHLGPQVGGMLTEFGAVGESHDDLELLHLQAAGADGLLQGWAYWTYKGYDDITTQNGATETLFRADGGLQEKKAKALARTYARAVAGQPTGMAFDPRSAAFELNFTAVAPPASAAGGGGEQPLVCGGVAGGQAGFVTEVFMQLGYHYRTGFSVGAWVDGAEAAEGAVAWAVAEAGRSLEAGAWQVLAFAVDPAAVPPGALVTLRIAREGSEA